MSFRFSKKTLVFQNMIGKRIYLVVVGFIIFSCSTSEDNSLQTDDQVTMENDDEVTVEEEIPNSTNKLSKIVTTNNNSSFTVDFIYDSDKLISLLVDSGEAEERLIYEDNLPIKVERYSNGNLTSFSDFEYENGVFKRERNFNDGINTSYTDYTFQDKNLIKVERFSQNQVGELISTFSREFNYDDNENVELVVQIELIAANTQMNEFNYTYDMNEHYMTGLPEEIRFLFWDDDISISNNNFISETTKTSGQITSEETFEFTYNSDGLPMTREEFDSDGQSINTTEYFY